MKQSHQVPYSVRQGDVLLVDAAYRSGVPADATEITATERVVLAYGEVTGHAHAIAEPVKTKYFDARAERFLCLLQDVTLRHEEHGAILLDAGRQYQQAFQCEDFGTEVRRVSD